jgi:hypothetical protein
MFARVTFVTCLALLLLWLAAKSEESPRAAENGSAAGDAVSNTESMAERELEIARYYMSRHDYLAQSTDSRSWLRGFNHLQSSIRRSSGLCRRI